ncbi:MAG: putative quinol monooxygenase [Phycicoccus sp.]
MTTDRGVLATLEAREGKEHDLAEFLRNGREIALTEAGTVTWYAFRIDERTFGIFDTFPDEDARQAHLTGAIPAALGDVAAELLGAAPVIRTVDLLAVKREGE